MLSLPCLAWLEGIPTQQIGLNQFLILLLSLLRLCLLVKHLRPLQSLLGNLIVSDNIKLINENCSYLTWLLCWLNVLERSVNSSSGDSWPNGVNMGTKTAACRRRPPRMIRSLFCLSDSTTRDLLGGDSRVLMLQSYKGHAFQYNLPKNATHFVEGII